MFGPNSPLKDVPFLRAIFWIYKMNEIINKAFVNRRENYAWNAFKRAGFTYSACGSFAKNKERIKKFKKNMSFNIYLSNKLDNAYFQHDLAYGDFWPRGIAYWQNISR